MIGMYTEKRPTAVSVIGWAWIVLGALFLLSSVMQLAMLASSQQLRELSAAMMFIPVSGVTLVVGLAAVVSGKAFLKMRAWSRLVVELLTWLLLIATIGFMIYWLYNWLSIAVLSGDRGFAIAGAVMGGVVVLLYAVPIVLMLRSLRGEKMRQNFADLVAE